MRDNTHTGGVNRRIVIWLSLVTLGIATALVYGCGQKSPPPQPVGTRAASDEPPIRVKGGSVWLTMYPVNGLSNDWVCDSSTGDTCPAGPTAGKEKG